MWGLDWYGHGQFAQLECNVATKLNPGIKVANSVEAQFCEIRAELAGLFL